MEKSLYYLLKTKKNMFYLVVRRSYLHNGLCINIMVNIYRISSKDALKPKCGNEKKRFSNNAANETNRKKVEQTIPVGKQQGNKLRYF